MKRKVIFAVVCISVLCLIVGAVQFGLSVREARELQAIKDSVNTSLTLYNSNKELALSYLNVYKIKDESTYQSIKSSMYEKLGSELQSEIFPTVNYKGLALHDISYSVIDIMGTNNTDGEENTFKVEYNLTGINYNQDIVNLITIANGKIISVERIN